MLPAVVRQLMGGQLTVDRQPSDSWLTVSQEQTGNSWATDNQQGLTILHFYFETSQGLDAVTIFIMRHAHFCEVLFGRKDLSPQNVL